MRSGSELDVTAESPRAACVEEMAKPAQSPRAPCVEVRSGSEFDVTAESARAACVEEMAKPAQSPRAPCVEEMAKASPPSAARCIASAKRERRKFFFDGGDPKNYTSGSPNSSF
jgi:hypothetical protein